MGVSAEPETTGGSNRVDGIAEDGLAEAMGSGVGPNEGAAAIQGVGADIELGAGCDAITGVLFTAIGMGDDWANVGCTPTGFAITAEREPRPPKPARDCSRERTPGCCQRDASDRRYIDAACCGWPLSWYNWPICASAAALRGFVCRARRSDCSAPGRLPDSR